MRLAAGVEWAIHGCIVLARLDEPETLAAADLAAYFDLPPAYFAKSLQALSTAGIVASTRGQAGGYRMARPATAVTMLDIVDAIDPEPAFRCTEIRRRGPTGQPDDAYPRLCGIAVQMRRAESAWRTSLAGVTIADLMAGAKATGDSRQRRAAAQWLAVNVRRPRTV